MARKKILVNRQYYLTSDLWPDDKARTILPGEIIVVTNKQELDSAWGPPRVQLTIKYKNRTYSKVIREDRFLDRCDLVLTNKEKQRVLINHIKKLWSSSHYYKTHVAGNLKRTVS